MIGLVSCSARKLGHVAPARDLYCSPMFRMSLAYAERTCDRVYILSAAHGLVTLDQPIAPYERRLSSLKEERHRWGSRVASSLTELGHHGADLTILAGKDYACAVLWGAAGWWPRSSWREHVALPLAGLGLGARLRWLSSHQAG